MAKEVDFGNNYLLCIGINKIYSNGLHAVKDVSCSIAKGGCLGLVGESGCGKSTLARCILLFEKITSGEIYLGGQQLNTLYGKDLRRERMKMQVVFQNPNTALNAKLPIIDQLLEPLDNQKDVCPEFIKDIRDDRRAIGKRLLDMMDLPERYLDMYPHELSGGQKQRITIARAISINPSLIILDEPTASLDVSVQARILNLLKSLQAELNLTYLFISHDLSAVNFMADKVMVMYKGEIVDRFDKSSIFAPERHDYTKKLLNIFEGNI